MSGPMVRVAASEWAATIEAERLVRVRQQRARGRPIRARGHGCPALQPPLLLSRQMPLLITSVPPGHTNLPLGTCPPPLLPSPQ